MKSFISRFKISEIIILTIGFSLLGILSGNSSRPEYADASYDVGYYFGVVLVSVIIAVIIEAIIVIFVRRNKDV